MPYGQSLRAPWRRRELAINLGQIADILDEEM